MNISKFPRHIIILTFLSIASSNFKPIEASCQPQQDAQWPFYLAFEDATGAKDSIWFLIDTASTYPLSISGLFGEEPIESDPENFQVWFNHPLDLQSGNIYNTLLSEPITEGFDTEVFSENGLLPITISWDSTLFTADVLFEYGDPINEAIFDNQYFFIVNNGGPHHTYNLTYDNHVVMETFTWGDGSQFPLYVGFNRGPLGTGVGLDELNNLDFSIYPNPSSGNFQLLFEKVVDANIRLYNSTGKLVLKDQIKYDNKQINLKGLEAGLYFVEIQNEEGRSVKKLVVNR